ncbi:transposase [Vibrio cholerae]|nr:IS1634 family transposase [Vibrio cholerae]GIC28082.1 transposase [Vibrio cholerae]
MFILATNDTDNTDLTMVALLEHYKSQQKVERGFRFLKSPEFLTSSIFLKKPQRIEALLMIMTLSLLVYASLEHKIRESLTKTEEFFPSMVKNKTTTKPTARWVFLKFEGIDTLEFGGQSFITGVQEHQTRLLKLLGVLYEAVYS